MNIFYLDYDTTKCAKYHNDKHVVKMILETAQLLCGAHWASGGEAPYKLSHKNHPSAKWVREDINNYHWLCSLGVKLCNEYSYRYGKNHKTESIIYWCIENLPNVPDVGFTPPPLAMPDEYKESSHVQSYRNYYMGEKRDFCNWKHRDVPSWFV